MPIEAVWNKLPPSIKEEFKQQFAVATKAISTDIAANKPENIIKTSIEAHALRVHQQLVLSIAQHNKENSSDSKINIFSDRTNILNYLKQEFSKIAEENIRIRDANQKAQLTSAVVLTSFDNPTPRSSVSQQPQPTSKQVKKQPSTANKIKSTAQSTKQVAYDKLIEKIKALNTQYTTRISLLTSNTPHTANSPLGEISTGGFISGMETHFLKLAVQTSDVNKIVSYTTLIAATIPLIDETPVTPETKTAFTSQLKTFKKSHNHSAIQKIIRCLAIVIVATLSLGTILPQLFESTWYKGDAAVITQRLNKLFSFFSELCPTPTDSSSLSAKLESSPCSSPGGSLSRTTACQ